MSLPLITVLGWVAYGKLLRGVKTRSQVGIGYQLHQMLTIYAAHHDGVFPVSSTTSNDAFRELFRAGLIDDERLFYMEGCAWCGGKKPDGVIGTIENGFAEAVGKNENHWAYTSGLNLKTSPANTPLVMSGFTETPGIWCGNTSKKGGVWAGEYATIVRVSGRMKVWRLDSNYRAVETINGKQRDTMDLVKLVPEAKLLNPDG